jgi:hypothetical protein
LTQHLQHPDLPPALLARLRAGLSDWRSRAALPAEANAVVSELCASSRSSGWSAEQLVVAVKHACYSSEEMTQLTTTSERDALLSKVISACIREYFRDGVEAGQ